MSSPNTKNRLANEKSPYLLQHAQNPVDWYPWGEEAFEKANLEDKPVFLSIGYSTCHWCHVMERESFEDNDVASLLNKSYISIKVDREERPDIDSVYMDVCHALTGSGGWPLTIIMTPDKKPFFTGTYFPKTSRMNMPGLIDVLAKITEYWESDKNTLISSGETIIEALKTYNEDTSDETITEDVVHRAFKSLKSIFDPVYGGFGHAPKFPSPHTILFLLRYWKSYGDIKALELAEKTLLGMYKGGIFDHVGFGLSRYSTDEMWLVPHFEKMLYDNALSAIAYLELYQASSKKIYAEIADKILNYILRDMTSPEGGFYSAEDADSEGEEGKFYIWSKEEIGDILGDEDSSFIAKYYGFSDRGNFEGRNIPNLIFNDIDNLSAEELSRVEKCRNKLYEKREQRIHPFKDDKILTSWNGLAIAAFALGARVLKNSKYLSSAKKAVSFILNNLYDSKTNKLMARYREGDTTFQGYSHDYAFLIWGLIELYESTFDSDYLEHAFNLSNSLIDNFWDKENGGLFLYSNDGEQLISKPKEIYDSAIPSANSVSALNFLRLSKLSWNSDWEEYSDKLFRFAAKTIKSSPTGCLNFLSGFLFSLSKVKEIIIMGENDSDITQSMIKQINSLYLPYSVFHLNPEYEKEKQVCSSAEFIKNLKKPEEASAYICENNFCLPPISDINKFSEYLKS